MGEDKWIRVSEQLPRMHQPVWGYDRYYQIQGEAYWDGRKEDNGLPRLVFADSDDCHITHWQPLPGDPVDIDEQATVEFDGAKLAEGA